MTKFKEFPSQLEIRSKDLLIKTNITGKQIASATGLSEAWISDFLNGKVKHASAGRLEALYNYLSSSPLKV